MEKEKKENKIGMKQVLRYFLKVSIERKLLLFFVLFWIVWAALVSIYLPVFYANIIDVISGFTWTNKSELVPQLLWILIIIWLLEIWSLASWRIFWFSMIPFELAWVKKVYKQCFDYLHRHSYQFFTDNFAGSLVKKVNKLAGSYERMVEIFVFDLLRLAIIVPLIVYMVFVKNAFLGFIFLMFVVVYWVLQYFIYKANIPYEIAANRHDSKITGELSDTITNNYNLLTFATLKKELRGFSKTLFFWEKAQKKVWYRAEYIRLFSDFILVGFEIITIYFAIQFWWKDLISTGTIVLLQTYIFKLFSQMMFLWNVFKRFNRVIGESSEMLEILETPHDIIDVADAQSLSVQQWEIVFSHVKFGYLSEELVFQDLNLHIKSGEKVALVWLSWSGKTTVTRLLFRFFDIQDWQIFIDNQDISQVTQESLRTSLSIVPQDPILFHRSLKENILYGNDTATEKDMIKASKMARCHDFISELKEGYNTLVWERWIKLSGWERQRVAIARAILENKKILVLDEATSSLDSESEKLIQEAMDEVMKNKTTIVVAHRLSTIMKMDRIIVMDQWKIIEDWTHQQLLKKDNWVYKRLWDIQSGGFMVE